MQPIGKSEARQAFARLAGLDPEGLDAHLTAADIGQCFQLTNPRGSVVYSVGPANKSFWIHAAAGMGQGMTEAGLAAIECQARRSGCRVVGFQTLRRGLIRRAQRLGYAICGAVGTGFILRKNIA